MVRYTHSENPHTVEGARKALPFITRLRRIDSILDVGVGTGSWLRAAKELGVTDLLGVDGVPLRDRHFCVDQSYFLCADLTIPLDLGRKFDLVLCLEVGEHIAQEYASVLVKTLCAHGDFIVFSAAAPFQGGEHHVNCQWPSYWQSHFNQEGFACSDALRFEMWDEAEIEPWYRQNIFVAAKDPISAGLEPRIQNVLHPEVAAVMIFPTNPAIQELKKLHSGALKMSTYFELLKHALIHKILRKIIYLYDTIFE